MNQNEYIKELEKIKEQIRENEAHGRQQGNISMYYTTDDVKRFIESGELPRNIGEWYLKWTDEQNQKFKKWQKFLADNPTMSDDEKWNIFHGPARTLSMEETVKSYTKAANLGQMCTLMWKLKCAGLFEQDATNQVSENEINFFKSLNADEFGISRLMADPLNNVPKMLDKFSLPEFIREDTLGYNIYEIESVTKNSLGDTLRLKYRCRAQNQDDANKLTHAFIQRMTGRQKKVFEACWAMANKRLRRAFTCNLSDLMKLAYPNRKDTYFSTDEKVEFYQDMLDLADTKLEVEKKKYERSSKKKKGNDKYILPFITIHKTTDSLPDSTKQSEKYPNQISISVLHNPLYEADKMYNVGAAIKYKTLELHADDLQLAEWIQIRKSQSMKEKYITFTSRDDLLKIAKLDGITHTGTANRALLQIRTAS
jgi:hypothetical protein